MDFNERQGTNISSVPLDWEKAFDKIDQEKLIQVLQRLSVPQNIIQVFQNIFREAKFRVTKGDFFQASERKIQGFDRVVLYHPTCSVS